MLGETLEFQRAVEDICQWFVRASSPSPYLSRSGLFAMSAS